MAALKTRCLGYLDLDRATQASLAEHEDTRPLISVLDCHEQIRQNQHAVVREFVRADLARLDRQLQQRFRGMLVGELRRQLLEAE